MASLVAGLAVDELMLVAARAAQRLGQTDGALVAGLHEAFSVALGFIALAAVAAITLVGPADGQRQLFTARWNVSAASLREGDEG